MKFFLRTIKKLILAFSVIYTMDVLLESANIFVPINVPTLIIGVLLGPLGIIALIIISITIK